MGHAGVKNNRQAFGHIGCWSHATVCIDVSSGCISLEPELCQTTRFKEICACTGLKAEGFCWNVSSF